MAGWDSGEEEDEAGSDVDEDDEWLLVGLRHGEGTQEDGTDRESAPSISQPACLLRMDV